MQEGNFLTLAMVVVLGGIFAYRMSFLQKKKLWHFSLQQIMVLVVLPGVFFPLIFSYLQTIVMLPRLPNALLPDKFLVNTVLLSILFSYGGVAIHAVTKEFNVALSKIGGEIAEVNRFFHLTFSHNLAWAGSILALCGITLLEISHVNSYASYGVWGGILRGLLLSGVFILGTYSYTRYSSGDVGKWSDLKVLFIVVWMAFIALLYAVRRLDPRVTEYQLLLPSLLSFSLMAFLSFVLVFRRMRRGWKLYVSRRRLKKVMAVGEG